MSGIEGQTYCRYMSRAEADAVERTGFLRGGRGSGFEETYWTNEIYASAAEAKSRLALRRPPEVRVAFRITNAPALLLDGARVSPSEDEPGGGIEWMTLDAVEVEVIDVEDLD
jgi:hypothetical protein